MTILALSSGESELAAVVKGAGEALGYQSGLQDFGANLPIELHSDATVAIGMCRREGLGRVRHLSTSDLWVQQLVRHKRIQLFKCGTLDNISDILTKGMARDRTLYLMNLMYYQLQGGRATAAPVREHTSPLTSPIEFESDNDGSDCYD